MRLRGVWGLAEGAASPEEGGGLRAGAERGRGRLRGEGGRERGVKRLWRGEKRQEATLSELLCTRPFDAPFICLMAFQEDTGTHLKEEKARV